MHIELRLFFLPYIFPILTMHLTKCGEAYALKMSAQAMLFLSN